MSAILFRPHCVNSNVVTGTWGVDITQITIGALILKQKGRHIDCCIATCGNIYSLQCLSPPALIKQSTWQQFDFVKTTFTLYYSRDFYIYDTRPWLQWRHNHCDGVSNHRRLDCFLSRLFRRKSKKISWKIIFTYLCEGDPLAVTGGFPSQRAIDAENVSIWWRHHGDVAVAISYTHVVSITPSVISV